ncbi:MAG: recombinase family protein [Lachnospiraceae bacterium]|nr:recombinase family protein [Lachnospiraceae bacterium]MDD3616032.1 recombinase family protein [Lachnospiraceae bacterium]
MDCSLLFITKSVSRFARNTADSLSNVRKLREKGVEIYFEKENIWTLDAKGELMITIMSSLAQEESRSISENTTWGKRKQFADGKGSVGYKCGCCGGWYGSKVWHSRNKYRKVIYRCNRKYGKGIEPCNSPHFTEEQIKEIFLKALNTLIDEKDEAIANLQELIDTVCDTGSFTLERDGIEQELIMMAEHIENLIRENA